MSPPLLGSRSDLSGVTSLELVQLIMAAAGLCHDPAARRFYSADCGLNSYHPVGILPKERSPGSS